MPGAVGNRTRQVKILNACLAKLHQAAYQDPMVATAFHQVATLLAPPPSLLHPRIVWSVLTGAAAAAIAARRYSVTIRKLLSLMSVKT